MQAHSGGRYENGKKGEGRRDEWTKNADSRKRVQLALNWGNAHAQTSFHNLSLIYWTCSYSRTFVFQIQYHITFIEDRASRAWLPFWELRQFHTDDVATSQGEVCPTYSALLGVGINTTCSAMQVPNHYRRSIERAVRSASMLASMDLRVKYIYVHMYTVKSPSTFLMGSGYGTIDAFLLTE